MPLVMKRPDCCVSGRNLSLNARVNAFTGEIEGGSSAAP